jgi:hypothetical protein
MAKHHKVKLIVKPTERELAALAISFLLVHSTDQQIARLLQMTLRDWVNWLHVPPAGKKRRR